MVYLFLINSEGGIIGGQILSDWVVGNEDVWNAQNRAFYDAVAGQWVIYGPIVMETPTSVTVGTVFTITVTLPSDSPDKEVVIRVDDQDFILPVTNGQAKKDISLNKVGEHSIEALTRHHGGAHAKVIAT